MILEINGHRVEVDDSFGQMTPEQQNQTVDEIAKSLGPAVPSPADPAMPGAVQPQGSAPAGANVPDYNLGRDMTYLAQRGDRGIADALGAPVDIMSAGLNLGAYGIDKIANLFGGSFPTRIEEPFGGSDSIANLASKFYESAGAGPVIPDEQVPGPIQAVGSLVRGGSSMLVPGMGMASKPAQEAAAIRPTLKAFTNPYEQNAGSTLTRDAVAGGGSAAGSQAYDDYVSPYVPDSIDPIAKTLAAILGGVGGAVGSGIVESSGRGLKAGLQKVFGSTDANAPIDQMTGRPYPPAEMDKAAAVAQTIPTSKYRTIDQLDERKFDFAPPNARPTTGMQSDDVGMALHENQMRTAGPRRFIERDTNRRALASDKVDESAPAGANPRTFTDTTQQQYDTTLGLAEQQRQAAEDAARQGEAAIAAEQARLREYANSQPQASTRLAGEINQRQDELQAEKNARFRQTPDETVIPGQPVLDQLDAVRAGVPELARNGAYGQQDAALRARLQGDPIVDAQGNPTGEFQTRDLTYGDLRAGARPAISAARTAEVTSGGSPEMLDRLGGVVNRQVDQANPGAADYYRETFVPQVKTGEMGEYYNARKRANKTGEESAATAPSKVAGRFLKTPEGASRLPALQGEPARPFPQNDIGDYLLGEMAKADLTAPNGQLRYDRFRRWADKNRSIIDQFPEARQRIDQELATAQQGGQLSQDLADQVTRARGNADATKRELDRSSLAQTLGKDPVHAVGSIIDGPDPARHMADLIGRLRGQPDAMDGLKAAVRDYIKERTANTGQLLGHDDAAVLSQSKMDKLFRKHEALLAQVYSPDEMQALRQAHKLLSVESSRGIRAGTGSDTAEKAFNSAKDVATQQRKRMLEAALKLKYGVLVGGGINRTINVFLAALPNHDRALGEILYEMNFNPDLAKHLLTRPIKEVKTPGWNAKLNRLLAYATGAREANKKREPAQ